MDRIKDFLDYAMEGYILGEDDFSINMDLWGPGKHNVLFITGISGAGKTTMAGKIQAEKKHAIHFELDNIEYHFDKSNTGIIEQLIKEFPEYAKLVADAETKAEATGRPIPCKFTDGKLLDQLYMRAVEIMHGNPKQLYIAEGVQVYCFAGLEIVHEPLIMLGASAVKSLIQRLKRTHSKNGKIDWNAALKDEFFELCRFYATETKTFMEFRKGVKHVTSNKALYPQIYGRD